MNRSRSDKARILNLVLALGLGAAALASSELLEGKYQSQNRWATLELKAAGKATFTLMGDTEECTYSVEEKKLRVTCKNNKYTFEIRDDGSLHGLALAGPLKKVQPEGGSGKKGL